MKESSIIIKPFGSDGGGEFQLSCPKIIGLRSGKYLDQIKINGIAHGGGGGAESISLELGPDEYIHSLKIRSGKYVDRVHFETNKGRILEGGGGGGGEQTLEGIRVLSIGGRSGRLVDKLRIRYIENYGASTIVEENANFILSYVAPFEQFETYTETKDKVIHAYEKITQSMVSTKFSANVVGEYYVVASLGTDIEFKDTTTESIKSQIEHERDKINSVKKEIPEGYVGIHLASGRLMKEDKGETCWMYLTSTPSYSVIKQTEIKSLLGHYDLTGQLFTQMAGLKPHKIIKNGYVFYK